MSCSYARCSSEQSDSLEMYTKTAKTSANPQNMKMLLLIKDEKVPKQQLYVAFSLLNDLFVSLSLHTPHAIYCR